MVNFYRNDIKKIYKKIYWLLLEKPISFVFYYLPIKKSRIVFDNFGGKGFGGNPKFIAEALYELNNTIQMIWLVDEISQYDFPKFIKPVEIDSIKALYMRATAKIWVDNIRHRHPIKKKTEQIYLQSWHGTMSAKRVERDAENLLDKKYIEEAKYDGMISNAIIADNRLQEQVYLRAFWLSKNVEILRYGFPQNDNIRNKKMNFGDISKLKYKLSIEDSDFIVLYAPTFRDDLSTKGYEINFDQVINVFENVIKKPTKIIIRLHPNCSFQKSKISFSDTILDGTDYPNIQDLAVISDVIISDYSSTLFDFAALNKPAFVCALDFEEYKLNRGFIPEFEEFPFPVAKSNKELIEIIRKFDFEKYKKDVANFYYKYPFYGDGHASVKTAKWILKHMYI